jgi:signal transduction histidine kinase
MPRSLRWRLLAGAAVAILAALGVAWVVMTLLFDRHIERRLAQDLTRDAERLVAALSLTPEGPVVRPEPRLDPRLETPAGGLYWQVSTPRSITRSRSLWDQALPPPPTAASAAEWTLRRGPGPFDAPLMILERTIQPDPNGPRLLVQFAEDATETATARAEFGRELALFLAGLWAVLLGAAWVQVQVGLHPLARIGRDLSALRSSPSARLPEPRLADLKPLADAINDLAAAREVDLRGARVRAADLAHGLKTPLAALAAQSRRLAAGGAAADAEALDRSISAITMAVEAELARSRVAVAGRAGQAEVGAVVDRLTRVLEQTERGEALIFTRRFTEPMVAAAAPEDLIEALGPLMENAARFARRQVRVTADAQDGVIRLAIDDDGPGIAADRVSEAFSRGARLDEAGEGHGLGLSISRDILERLGGDLTLTRSDLGGLRTCVRLRRAVEPTP